MSSQLRPIRGKVARVLNAREVAINKGQQDGVEVGMIFKILSTKGLSITDPETGEPLGSVDLEKVKVKVTIVQELIAVASTYKTRRINVGGSGFAVGSIFDPPKWETRVETLKIDEAAIEELDEADAFVRTGDPVVQHIEVIEVDLNKED